MTSNPPETLQLVADELESPLHKHLGPHPFYVLVIANDLLPDSHCNAISNIPADPSDDLRHIFGELSTRHVMAHN